MMIAQSTTIQAYQLRKGGARARMAILRMIAVDSANNYNESTRLHPGDWRGARHYTMGSYAAAYACLNSGMQGTERIWYSHAGAEFRNERESRQRFSTDDDGEFAIGIVAGLTHGRFIAGYRWTSNDERVYFGDVYDDEDDALRMSNEHARVFAESAYEDSQRFDAMQKAESDAEEKTAALQESIALRHRAEFGSPERVRDDIQALRNARETLVQATKVYES